MSMKGKIKFFNSEKGFGFITGEDDIDYFVHATSISDGLILNDDDVVTFDTEDGDRGPKATNIIKV